MVKGKKRPHQGEAGTPAPKKIVRLPNPTLDEKDALVTYMEGHSNYATGRLKCPNARQKMQEMHQRMAQRVNNVKLLPGKKGGPDRSGDKWWKTWISMRNAAKAYAASNHIRMDTKTGGGGPDDSISSTAEEAVETSDGPQYTTDDKLVNRIMQIIGWHNALGLPGISDDLEESSEENESNDNDGQGSQDGSEEGQGSEDVIDLVEGDVEDRQSKKFTPTAISTPLSKKQKPVQVAESVHDTLKRLEEKIAALTEVIEKQANQLKVLGTLVETYFGVQVVSFEECNEAPQVVQQSSGQEVVQQSSGQEDVQQSSGQEVVQRSSSQDDFNLNDFINTDELLQGDSCEVILN